MQSFFLYYFIILYSTSRTKFPNLNVSRRVLQLFLLNPLEAGVKSRMKM